MKSLSFIILVLLLFTNLNCQEVSKQEKVFFGDELLLRENLQLLKDKQIGVVTNQSAIFPNGVHLVDTLLSLGTNITALFSPEHGIRGEASDGENISSSIDQKTGLPIFSLYGKTKKPTPEMLDKVDLILFDIQDIGARFYTYISTLYYLLQSSAENDIAVIVLDRPNPISGKHIEGPLLKADYKSFVGIAPIPVIHGMTVGELANYFVKENIINTKKEPELKVIKMSGWHRGYFWNNLNRKWIPTSPNIPKFETAIVYPGTCFLEGTNVSEGRGTDDPFLNIGAPFINSNDLIAMLNNFQIEGVKIASIKFTPKKIAGKSNKPKFEGVQSNGIKISVSDETKFKPVEFGVYLIFALIKLYPDDFKFKAKYFDDLAGNSELRTELQNGREPLKIINSWANDLEKFKLIRNKYLLY
ncbi:MAG: DUF1343 domain-containing protein [Ignavibacteria bacterium]|nr:MAG: DUF1343 domain-containing protein [Ignavibacteria bacterium]